MPRWLLTLLLSAIVVSPRASARSVHPSFDVVQYDVAITPDLPQHSLSAVAVLQLRARIPGLSQVELDAEELQIEAVTDGAAKLPFHSEGDKLLIDLAQPLLAGQSRALTIRYRATPTRGVKFLDDALYTAFSTARWMPCVMEPSSRARLHLRIIVPRGWQTIASGERVSTRGTAAITETVWSTRDPVPAYVFGFAVGHFRRATQGKNFAYLFPEKLSAADVLRAFALTPAAAEFFHEKSGVPLPVAAYSQVLLPGNIEQEVYGYTLLPEEYATALGKDPADLWLLAHELSHQWWGIGLTCRTWSDFWLNEGLASFMADAFLEKQFGPAAYERAINAARDKYTKMKNEGKDRPLSYHGWTTPQEALGALPYQKGAWVFHLLRQEIGDESFWKGLRLYTRRNFGRSVTSEDLQAAMEEASGKSLDEFFRRWVYQ